MNIDPGGPAGKVHCSTVPDRENMIIHMTLMHPSTACACMYAVGGTVTVGTAQVYGCNAIRGRGRYTGAITSQKNGESGDRKVDVPLWSFAMTTNR